MTVWKGAITAIVVLALAGGTGASAQEQGQTETQRQEQPPTLLPPVTVKPPPHVIPPESGREGTGNGTTTSDKKGDGKGDDKALDQLNRDLKRKVDEVNPTANTPPLDASSPDTKIGVVNIPGVQEQYGKNFGHSAVPYRPPPPVYAPIGGHR